MDETRAQQLARIRTYCAQHPRGVLFDEVGGTLFDVPAVKTLPVDLANLSQVEEKADKQTRTPYLLLAYGDGRSVGLTEAGIAFAPVYTNTGPLKDLPEAVCLRDYAGMVDRLKHDLYGHLEVEPTRQTLSLLLMCIATLDGARAAGFDVSRQERELEVHLAELEKRAPRPA